MANKYIKNDSGKLTEQEVIISSTGASDDGKLIGLNSTGVLDPTFLPPGTGPDLASILTSEALNAGDFINIWDDAGTTKVRKADASNSSMESNGFVLDNATSGTNVNVYFEGKNNQLSGLVGGTILYLSDTTPGAVSTTAPTTATYIVQRLGKAYSTTAMTTETAQVIILA